MFDALDVKTGERFRFRSLDSLVRRYRGHGYILVPARTSTPVRTVQIHRGYSSGRYDIRATIQVPAGAVNSATEDELRLAGHGDW